MTDKPGDLDEVQQRIEEIQSRKRGRIRWNVSKHTAELAIGALGSGANIKAASRNGKARRRKRSKRLL